MKIDLLYTKNTYTTIKYQQIIFKNFIKLFIRFNIAINLLIFILISNFLYSQNSSKPFYPSLLNIDSSDEQAFSFLGLYNFSLYVEDHKNEKLPRFVITDSNDSLISENAYTAICNKAIDYNIIIINEGHNLSNNRAFLYDLIDSLNKIGYTNYLFEGISNKAKFNQDELPNLNKSYYSKDVMYANLFRKLNLTKSKIYAYEDDNKFDIGISYIDSLIYVYNKLDTNFSLIKIDSITYKYILTNDERIIRECKQAFNIYNIIKQNSNEKFVINCGYSHGNRNENYPFLMGNTLRRLLNVETLIIDQVLLREHSSAYYEDSLYIKYSKNIKYPVVLKNSNNTYVNKINYFGNEIKNSIDMIVIYPRTKYINNRPTWQELSGINKRYNISKFVNTSNISYNYLVLCYDMFEYELNKEYTCPYDIVQVLSNQGNYDLLLKPATKYLLKIFNANNELVCYKKIKTK